MVTRLHTYFAGENVNETLFTHFKKQKIIVKIIKNITFQVKVAAQIKDVELKISPVLINSIVYIVKTSYSGICTYRGVQAKKHDLFLSLYSFLSFSEALHN